MKEREKEKEEGIGRERGEEKSGGRSWQQARAIEIRGTKTNGLKPMGKKGKKNLGKKCGVNRPTRERKVTITPKVWAKSNQKGAKPLTKSLNKRGGHRAKRASPRIGATYQNTPTEIHYSPRETTEQVKAKKKTDKEREAR